MSDALPHAVPRHGGELIPARQLQRDSLSCGPRFSATERRRYPTLLGARLGVAKDGKTSASDISDAKSEEAVDDAEKMCWTSILNFQMVRSLLREGNPNIRDAEVQTVFNALRKSSEDEILLGDLYDILHPLGGSFANMTFRTGNKLRKALDQARACKHGLQDQDVIGVLKGEMDGTALHMLEVFLRTPCSLDKCSSPGDYTGILSQHPHAPSASFGTGPGHDLPTKPTPGPGDYDLPKPEVLSPRRPSVSAGTAPARVHVVANIDVPGPAQYDVSADASSRYRSVPSITIGSEPRRGAHFSLDKVAPGSSNKHQCLHIRRHSLLETIPQNNRKSTDKSKQVESKAAWDRKILVGSGPQRWDFSQEACPGSCRDVIKHS